MNGMNVKRFTARTPRDALALVRQAFGEDAVVMSTRPCAGGVEVLAMAPESLSQLERVGAESTPVREALREPPHEPPRGPGREAERAVAQVSVAFEAAAVAAAPRGVRIEPTLDAPGPAGSAAPHHDARQDVRQDVRQLEMSTLSFQDYVRERMLRRRQTEIAAVAPADETARAPAPAPSEAVRSRLAAQQAARVVPTALAAAPGEPPVLRDALGGVDGARDTARDTAREAAREAAAAEQQQMLAELRSVRGLIEQRFGALAFMEKLQRQPRQAELAQRLLDIGLSPALTRKLAESLPDDVAEMTWAASVLERNLATGEREGALEDQGGVYALIGATGVGKTTSTAKLAAAFAARHGAANLGLITLDAYRVGAQEQLRTYGRILGVPVHTAHDRASLEDLLELLAAKRMVLIDTAGMAQRDHRTRELLEMLSHPSIKRLLVLNASAQGETIEDQLVAYGAGTCRGVVLSKLDEAVKLAPALDAVIRSRLKVLAVANGQRVPEDWHRLSASALVQRALKAQAPAAWRLDEADVSLVFAGLPAAAARAGVAAALG